MARYSFLTTWALGPPADINRVFEVLHDAQRYPSWWKGVLAVERLEEGDGAWNHDYVMRGGGEGLARVVGAPLLLSD